MQAVDPGRIAGAEAVPVPKAGDVAPIAPSAVEAPGSESGAAGLEAFPGRPCTHLPKSAARRPFAASDTEHNRRRLAIGRRQWGIGRRQWGIGRRQWAIGRRQWGIGRRELATQHTAVTPAARQM
jgi:hypothetical protein